MDEAAIARGREVMGAVYGQEFADSLPDPTSPAQEETMGHLFADVWSRPILPVRDRRLLVMGVIAMLGRPDVMETQAYGALVNGELTPEELDEVALQLHFYAGWPNGSSARTGIDRAIDRHRADR